MEKIEKVERKPHKLSDAPQSEREKSDKVQRKKSKPVSGGNKKRKKKKQSKAFRNFMWVYAAMWLVLTVILCVVLWKNLSGYQNNYDKAKAASEPKLAMDKAMEMFTPENAKGLVDILKPEIASRFETEEDYVKFYEGFLIGKSLTYVEDSEKYNAARPVYDVYADDDLFAIVSLKADGQKDDYGFNGWEVKDIVISENNYEYKDVYLKVMDDMTVMVNGMPLDEREYVRGGIIENELTDKAYELTGTSFGYKIYYAGDMIGRPKVQVTDAGGHDVTEQYVMADNDLRDYQTLASDSFTDSVYYMVKNFCETYVYHIYRKASANDVASMMEDGSQAESLLWNAQSTLAWAWVPDNVEILSEDYSDFIQYNDNYFSCKSTIMIKKSDSKTVEEEEFVCQWLFKKIGGNWQVTYFVLG